MSEETVTFNLELNTEPAINNVRRLETLVYRTLGLMRRLGLPEDISQAIYKVQRLIMVLRLAHTAMIALSLASGPIGYALAAVGIASAAVSFSDMLMDTGG